MADLLNKLNSANYITVKVTDNAIVNGNNLLAAYAFAKTKTPNGQSLSAVNRLVIILPIGVYDLGSQSLILDTEYIDIIGSTSDRSKHYIKSIVQLADRGTVQQTAYSVKLYNLTIDNASSGWSRTSYPFDDQGKSTAAAYFPNTDLYSTYIENVEFTTSASNTGAYSMRVSVIYSGTFVNCTAGDYSFGTHPSGGITSVATFKNCTGGNYSFGTYATYLDGIITDCTAGNFSFGNGINSNTSAIFKNCTAGTNSFISLPNSPPITNNCTFTNCTAGTNSFGWFTVVNNGTFTNCIGGEGSFQGTIASKPIIRNCFGGNSGLGL